jgi:hypothetical protein
MKKIEDLLGSILISDFNWRNLRIFLSVIIAGIACFYVYDYYTAAFELARLQKSADLLARLQEIQAHGTNSSPELLKAQDAITAQATYVIEQKPLTLNYFWSKRSCLPNPIVNFIISAFPFLIFSLILIPRKSQQRITSLAVVFIALALFSGMLGIITGEFFGPWFRLVGLPSIIFFIFLILILPSNYRAAKQTANRNKCINHLRLLDAAKQQWALENSRPKNATPSMEDVLKYLGNTQIAQCPCGGHYILGSVGTWPMCSIEGHSLKPR